MGPFQRGFAQQQWDGADRPDQTLLLHAEQCMGDTMQFIRYAPLAAERVGRVVLESQAPVMALLTGTAGIDEFVEQGADLPAFDVHLPLLSLPGVFGTEPDMVPADIPYITAPSARPTAGYRLLEVFKFIGITDHWALSTCLFHVALGGRCLPVENVNTRPTAPASAKWAASKLSTIETAVQLRRAGFYDPFDDQLFDDAQRRFHADLVKHQVTPRECSRLGCGVLPSEDVAQLELAWQRRTRPQSRGVAQIQRGIAVG